MARLNRICPVGVPQHIIQRGNNRQVCFAGEQGFATYAVWLKDYSKKYQVDIHAWVLMTNHVHLLCTPRVENAVSSMMQAIGRQYVRYFDDRASIRLCLVKLFDKCFNSMFKFLNFLPPTLIKLPVLKENRYCNSEPSGAFQP